MYVQPKFIKEGNISIKHFKITIISLNISEHDLFLFISTNDLCLYDHAFCMLMKIHSQIFNHLKC